MARLHGEWPTGDERIERLGRDIRAVHLVLSVPHVEMCGRMIAEAHVDLNPEESAAEAWGET